MGKIKEAIEIYKLNRMVYPEAADATDDLADVYLADGQKNLARQYAEKTLELLHVHSGPGAFWNDTAQRRGDTCDDAKDVLKKVEGKSQ